MAKFPWQQIARTCCSQITSCKHAEMKRLLGNEYMDYRGNKYANYNRQTVVVGVFYVYMVLLKLWKERYMPERFRIQETTDSSNSSCYQAVRAVCSRRVMCKTFSCNWEAAVEENSKGSRIVEVLEMLFHVCNRRTPPINPLIWSRTRYFCHMYPP
jgi:hypothetical protein